jgi:hypothetical protein
LLQDSCGDSIYLCLWSSELQEVSSVAFERNNKGQYATPLGRSDGSGGYSYSLRGGSSGGRWDTRSTGSSDREGDLPDRELLTQGKHVLFLGQCFMRVRTFLLVMGARERMICPFKYDNSVLVKWYLLCTQEIVTLRLKMEMCYFALLCVSI